MIPFRLETLSSPDPLATKLNAPFLPLLRSRFCPEARDLKARYRRSAIGFLWYMLQPLLTLVVLAAVFSALFLPAAILLAALFTLGAGFLLPPLSVFFHDIIEEADGPAGEVIDRYLRFSEEPEEETTRGTA